MSIVIKSNQLNTLIYKYLLEAGLSHTAYTLFNQSRLQSSLQQFKYDIKSGHLLMLLQKGLILSQIQSHVNFGTHQQCLEPFYLLKSHTCKITQTIKQNQSSFLNELNNNITQCIKRTNAIYNTQLVNKNYEEIVYEPRGANYFEKFQKFKLSDGEVNEDMLGSYDKEMKDLLRTVKIDGEKDHLMAIWNRNQNVIYLAQKDTFEDAIITKVYPCTLNAQLQLLNYFKLTPQSLIMVFAQNRAKLINRQTDQSIELTIPLIDNVTSIEPNPNIPNLVIFQTRNQYFVMNTKSMEEVMRGQGLMTWRGFDEYIIFTQSQLLLKSLVKQTPIITYKPLQTQTQASTLQLDQISISPNKTFFFIVNSRKNQTWVYTFEKDECLYMFDFSDDEEQLRQVIWSHRNEVDYLCILTDIAIRVWEVELNSYCLKIELEKYDLGDVLSIASLEKSLTETFLLVLGSYNLLVSDIANQKIQRVESPPNSNQMQNIGKNSVFVSTDQNVYFVDGQRLSDLFK